MDIYEAFDVAHKVSEITFKTLLNDRLGHAAPIAYLDKGKHSFSKSYQASANIAPSIIKVFHTSFFPEIRDIERLIIVGGGSYGSIKNQELALMDGLFEDGGKPALSEIVLIDVSTDFLEEGQRAIREFQEKHNINLTVAPIRADFKDVSGHKFDTIMQAFGLEPRENKRASVMMTGATFGNIESVSAMDKFPGNEVDVQMAHLADLVGPGSTVMFDHFTKIDTGVQYYDTRELAEFFNNIPVVMQKYCKGLHDFHVNGDNDGQQYFRYRARQFPNSRMIAHELVAEQPQTPRVVNGVERVFPINTGDTLNVMFSLQARADDITYRPVQNTGLASQMSVSYKDLQVMHVFRKVGTPGALYQPDFTYEQPAVKAAVVDNATIGEIARNGLSRIMTPIKKLRPLQLDSRPSPMATPA